jgi:hypothetical protein
MENLQRNKPTKTVSSKTLSGPLTWVILIVFVLSIFGFIQTIFSDSPATALRKFFNLCFDGKYEDAWDMVKLDSDYAKQYSGDVSKFKEMWTRTKTHGTTYLKIRIDAVLYDSKSTSERQVAAVKFTIMTQDQNKDNKTNVITNQINDANMGDLTLEKIKGQGWKLIRPRS